MTDRADAPRHVAATRATSVAASPWETRAAWWRWLAVAWLLVVLALLVHQWHFWRADRLDANVLSLLPVSEQSPEVDLATRQLTEAASRQVVVLLGTPTWADTRAAAQLWRDSVKTQEAAWHVRRLADDSMLGSMVTFYRPWRDRLLTPAQREALAHTPVQTLVRDALTGLYQPGAQLRMSAWMQDPLGLWSSWWSARASDSQARPRDGELWVSARGKEWVLLTHEIDGPAFRFDGQATHGAVLDAAGEAVRQRWPQAEVIAGGVPLHAEAAATQASGEVNTIGWGSLAAVLLLAWFAFRSVRPIALVGASLVIGTTAALSVTALVFGEVHLLTLVFGASLVGVAEDYGIHYFACRQGHPWAAPRSLMRQLLPSLGLALLTSVLAYLALAVADFPGLRQMALFSVVGLAAAMLTVVCWFPVLDGGQVPPNRFSQAVGRSLARWPRLPKWRRGWALYAALAVLCGAGVAKLTVRDDVRQLQSSPPALIAQQRQLSELLGLPSPAQFFLVRGDSADAVLQREEALKARLDAWVSTQRIAGYTAVSDWVPSLQRQADNAALTARVESEVLAGINAALGESLGRPDFASEPLTVAQWLAHPVSASARPLWLGELEGAHTSVVLLRGLNDLALLPELAAVAQGLPGVRWVDKPSEISELLGRYRVTMSELLVVGHALVLLALAWRFGRQSWRAWLPTVLASVITVALLGLLGQPWQLFNVLALLLLLGVGVDYGIFLLEHPDDGSAWMAVALGAGSTWLAFGLLGLSSTPALRAFGLTLMIGLALVSVLAPCLRVPPRSEGAA